MNQALINVAYLVASILFIFGLKGLAHPRTAVRGNLMAAVAGIGPPARMPHRDACSSAVSWPSSHGPATQRRRP